VIALVHHIHQRFPSNIAAKADDQKKPRGFLTPLADRYPNFHNKKAEILEFQLVSSSGRHYIWGSCR
jgi:hypothetical protein